MAELIEFKCSHDIYSDEAKAHYTLSNGLAVEVRGELPDGFFSAIDGSVVCAEMAIYGYCQQESGSCSYSMSARGVGSLASCIDNILGYHIFFGDGCCDSQSDNLMQEAGINLLLSIALANPVSLDCDDLDYPLYIVDGQDGQTHLHLSVSLGGHDDGHAAGMDGNYLVDCNIALSVHGPMGFDSIVSIMESSINALVDL